jgi:hypothetical protein
LCLLLKRVQDVNRFWSRRHVEHPLRTSDLNADFTDAWSDRLHRLPVVWSQSLLYAPQLEAGNARKSPRELPSQMSGLSGIGQGSLYKFLYLGNGFDSSFHCMTPSTRTYRNGADEQRRLVA